MLAYDPREDHPLAAAFLADQLPGRTPPLAIHADDGMFRYLERLRGGDRDGALVDYLRTGLAAARTLAPVLRAHLASRPRPARVLDFASGYGRVTRFLLGELGAGELTISDILPAAVAFQRERFGVAGFVSARRPEELEVAGRFDAILVASLFSHLPRDTFGAWLGRLAGLLGPGGLLVASTHDLARCPTSEVPAEDGFAFTTLSESDELDGREYGTAWVAEGFVDAAVAAIPGGFVYRRLPRGLWHVQDLYLIARRGEVDLAALPLDRGPTGDLWSAVREGGEALWIAGWAVDAEEPGGETVIRVALDGEPVAELRPVEETAEVARLFDFPGTVRGGWQGRVAPGRGHLRSTQTLLAKAVTTRGSEMVLYLGSVEALLAGLAERRLAGDLAAARRELQRADRFLHENAAVLAGLEARLAAMEASRFWRLRNLWLSLKRRLGFAVPSWP